MVAVNMILIEAWDIQFCRKDEGCIYQIARVKREHIFTLFSLCGDTQ